MIRKFLVIFFISLLLGCTTYQKPEPGTLIISQVPDRFNDETNNQWNTLGQTIQYSKDNKVIIYWAGYGGLTSMANSFIYKMKNAESRGVVIKFVVVGDSISNHADVTCYASYVTLDADLIFHPQFYSYGSKKVYTSYESQLNLFRQCIDIGRLTLSDVNNMYTHRLRLEINPEGIKTFKPDWGNF